MKANELRIGNWVMDRGNKILHITHWERENMIGQKMYSYQEYAIELHPLTEEVQHLKPIPITEEWLLKFENSEYEFYKQADGSYSLVDDYGDGTTHYLGGLKYVHQLQNLYFALTGQELTIKP